MFRSIILASVTVLSLSGAALAGNSAEFIQNGNGNTLSSSQRGFSNDVNAIQNGNGNVFANRQRGAFNHVGGGQNGDFNQIFNKQTRF